MENKVTFDYSKAVNVVGTEEVAAMEKMVEAAKEVLVSKSGLGNDFLGWIDLPVDYDKEEFERIKKAAEKIQKDSDVLLVIGIGGSYLGARAAIDFLNHPFYNNLSKENRQDTGNLLCRKQHQRCLCKRSGRGNRRQGLLH